MCSTTFDNQERLQAPLVKRKKAGKKRSMNCDLISGLQALTLEDALLEGLVGECLKRCIIYP